MHRGGADGLGTGGEKAAQLSRTRAPSRAFYVPGLRWWIAVLLMGVTVVNYLDRACLSVAAPSLKRDLAINEVDFSHIVMAFQITYLVMQPLAGRIIDWLNIRVGLALSIFWWSLAQALGAFAGGWRSFALFRGLLGMGEAGSFPGAAKTVAQWFRPRERTVAMGILNVGAGLGAAIAPPLVVYLILHYSWRSAFVVTGAVGLVWVAVWTLLYRAPEDHPWMSPSERALLEEGQDELVVKDAPAKKGTWRLVLSRRDFWALAVARFFSEPAWQFFTYWIPLYLVSERHMNLKQIGYFAWLPFVAGDVGCLFGGILSPLFIRLRCSVLTARKLSASVCAVLMVFAIFIGRAPTAPWAIVFFCIAAFAHQAMSSTLLTLPADLFPKRAVATANGLSGSVGGLGGTLFTMVVGIVAMKIGYGPLFTAIAFFDLIGSAVLWALLREPVQPGSELHAPELNSD
ncbi:MAG: MFS transporter [Polyangiaceae bacterium]|jgi:MFS transporter, ACS family, hexuronate transporter